MSPAANSIDRLLTLAEQTFGSLTEADKTLLSAVASHEVANYQAKTDDPWELEEIDELNHPKSAEQWGDERTLKADRLIWLLTTSEASEFLSFRGLRIIGAKIEETLDLEYATVSVPLIFDACVFTESLIFRNSRLRSLQLKGTYVLEIQADGMQVEGSVSFCDGFAAFGSVSLKGAKIEGDLRCIQGQFINPQQTALDASAVQISASVYLCNGFRAEGMVNLAEASIGGQLNCSESEFINAGQIAIFAATARIATDVFLDGGFKVQGEVNLHGTSIGRELSCSGGEFSNLDGAAICVTGATIAGNVLLDDGFKAQGIVHLDAVSIGGQLRCSGSEFSNAGQFAILANAVTIAADVFLGDGFRAEGQVYLRGATIGGGLNCSGGKFINEGQTAIFADAVTIAADVFFTNGFKAEGVVNLRGSTIGGDLKCFRGEFSNANQIAINADAVKIAADVLLCNGFKAKGTVSLRGASIGGILNCAQGEFINVNKTAINANAATIASGVYLCDDFKAQGTVSLLKASIGGALTCFRSEFNNSTGTAIDASAATIATDVFLADGFRAKGIVNLRGISIGGQLNCGGGEFINAGKTAIFAATADIAGDVFLSNGFKAEGMVFLAGASIGANLICSGGHFLNEVAYALHAESITINQLVLLGGQSGGFSFRAEGSVTFLNATIEGRMELRAMEIPNAESMLLDLRFAKVNTFSFKDSQAEKTWIDQMKPGQLLLNGFVYDSLNISNQALQQELLLKWLRLQINQSSPEDNNFALQPYEQLATVLKANGHQEAATEVLIAKENDRRIYGGLIGWGKFANRFLGITIDHGYRPYKALFYSIAIIVLGAIVFCINRDLMTVTDDKNKFFDFDPLVYSIDVFIPVVDFHQESAWLPDPNKGTEMPLLLLKTGALLRTYFWFQIVAGWVLTSLWVAGFTGLVRDQK